MNRTPEDPGSPGPPAAERVLLDEDQRLLLAGGGGWPIAYALGLPERGVAQLFNSPWRSALDADVVAVRPRWRACLQGFRIESDAIRLGPAAADAEPVAPVVITRRRLDAFARALPAALSRALVEAMSSRDHDRIDHAVLSALGLTDIRGAEADRGDTYLDTAGALDDEDDDELEAPVRRRHPGWWGWLKRCAQTLPLHRNTVGGVVQMMYLSTIELGEMHEQGVETARSYFKDDRYPPCDSVIGGGLLRGKVPGLDPVEQDPQGRSDARWGWLPETGVNWEKPGRGFRADLHEDPAPATRVAGVRTAAGFTMYLSVLEFGEIHGHAAETARAYFKDGRYPLWDAVVGGGLLRGKLPGLDPVEPDPKKRSDARYGYLPETALNWRKPGRGYRSDLHD
ncbi:hypothetical protein [Nocardia altamirensis]|uniref:hypothetical protein n=1 Tax=Nocardia altamirensis TaxID=472158 RepID=UPI0008405634|nr:hypothetical protein [Nocardia altamirensis]